MIQHASIDDSTLFERITRHDAEAFGIVMRRYAGALYAFAFRIVGDTLAAEDIVQDLFATMWEKKMRFLSLPSFRTYLYNSIRNASLKYLKHQNVESLYLERLASTYREITEEEDTNEEEVYRLLFRAIDKLPTRCREIFLLHMDGKKNEEIATALGISIETVKTQKKRAIQSIKEQMGTCYFLLPLCDILYSSKFFS